MFIPQVSHTLGATSNFVPIVHGLAISHTLKWVMNKVGNRNFAWPIRNYKICSIDPIRFLLGIMGGVGFSLFIWCSHQFPTMFLSNSQWIRKIFSNFSTFSLPCSQKHLTLSHMFYSLWKLYTWVNIGTSKENKTNLKVSLQKFKCHHN